MLAYVLALAVGFGSLAIYMAAFFFPEIHRKSDFIWSGVGFFYALVLWVCAGRVTGGFLLGQVAGVALLGWSVTQMLQLRREVTPRQQQTAIPTTPVKHLVQEKVSQLSIQQRLAQLSDRTSSTFSSLKTKIQPQQSSVKTPSQLNVSSSTVADKPIVQIIDQRTPIPAPPVEATEMPQVIPPTSESPDELIQAARESNLGAEAEFEPALTEEEAIALAKDSPPEVALPPAAEASEG